MKLATLVSSAGALLVAVLPSGCGEDLTLPGRLDGHEVGTMAERELEAENPRLVPGTLACPDLDLHAGASVRCLRTAELSAGRVVKVRGTVAVTSLASGGRLHVTMDADAEEFGVTGEQVAAELRKRFLARSHVDPSALSCPYLRGRVGERVVCRLQAGGVRRDVDVVVTAVDAEDYRTTYVMRPHHESS